MKKVGIFSTFYEAKSGYSLISVAETQIRMLLDHDHEPVVLVQKQWSEDKHGNVKILPFEQVPPPSVWNEKTIDLRYGPAMRLDSGVVDDFEKRATRIEAALRDNFSSVGVIITHDIILQEWYKEHNVAMRRYAATRPDLLWLHWIHSCPMPSDAAEYPANCRYSPPPGYIIYPNEVDKPFAVRTYGLAGQEWRVIACRAGHAIDPLLAFDCSKLTKDLVRKTDFMSGDVTAIYPARLDRGKQPGKIIRLMAGVQRAGWEPRLIIADWQSQGKQFQKYMDKLIKLAESLDLEGKVFFTSRLDDRCNQGVPRRTVLELMHLSNIYVHPSSVETYSLVVHEAFLSGCLVCLNHDFPAMRELFGPTALYFDFGSDRTERTYSPNEQAFWNDEAMRLLSELRRDRVAMGKTEARLQWSPQAQWREFAPLLHLQPVAGEGQWTS